MASNKTNTSKTKKASPADLRAKAKQAKQQQLEEALKREKQKRDIIAIVLLLSGVFTFLLAVIKGESGWTVLHNVFFGIFGFSAFVLPFLLIYLSAIISIDRSQKNLISKSIEVGLLVLFISSLLFVFRSFGGNDLSEYFSVIKSEFAESDPLGGGVFGVLLGFPLGALLGPTGAKIITLLATLTDLMIITGTTVSKITAKLQLMHEHAKTNVEDYRARKQEIREQEAAEQQEVDELAYSSEKVYRSKKMPDLEIYDPAPDVITGEKPVRAGSKKAKKSVRIQPEEPEEVQDVDVDFIQPQNSVYSDEDFDAKYKVIDEAASKRGTKNKANKSESTEIEQPVDSQNAEEETTRVYKKEPAAAKTYKCPSLALLDRAQKSGGGTNRREDTEKAAALIETLESFGVEAQIVGITKGPTVTRFDIKPAVGVRINRITNLSQDIALCLATSSIRIAAIPDKGAIGIEVPNKTKNTVGLRSLLESDKFAKLKSNTLTVALGETISGEPEFANLAKMPHLLIAGTTGSGKSVCLNSMIMTLLFNTSPEDVQFIMIDPKGVELTVYNGIPHMPTPVVKEAHKAAGALAWAVKEMMNRYAILEHYKVRDITGYNKLALENPEEMKPLHKIVVIIDELADLMMVSPHEVEDSICRLAQMARAAGIHLVIATQSPRADVITGLIKANIPSRIALSVSNGIDSRIILDQSGAENLLGNGDMLFNPVGAKKPLRIQGCYVGDAEIERVCSFLKKQGTVEYDEEMEKQFDVLATKDKSKKAEMEPQGENASDELIEKAIETILEYQNASTSFLQRKLSVGYSRGARIIDELEQMGIVGPQEGSKPRKILITKNEWIERNAASSNDQISMGDDLFEPEDTETGSDNDFE